MIEPLALDMAGLKRREGSHTGALMNSSEDLIMRARAGEHEAFRLIFERYAKPVLSFIYDMVGERDLAENCESEDSNQISPSEELFGKELNTAIHDALNLLDDDRRLVFILKVFQQCRYEEIAHITGFSVAKIKTDLHRARIELRRRIRPFLETSR